MIAVNGDEKVDLENTQVYQKASRPSLTSIKTIIVTTCCIYKSASYIYLFNNCKRESIFSTLPRVLRDQISQEILVGIITFLCLLKNLPLTFRVQTPLQNLERNSLYQVLNISYFSHFTSNISGQQCMCLEADLAWKTCTFGLTKKLSCLDSFIYEKLLNYTAMLFYSK